MTEKKARESYNFGVDTKAKRLYTKTTNQGETMVEKRFTLGERKCYFTSLIFDNQKNEKMGSNEAMELLNEQHEENQSLKKEIENNIDSFKRSRSRRIQVEEENEQLKKENKELEAFRYAVFKNLHKITEKEHRE